MHLSLTLPTLLLATTSIAQARGAHKRRGRDADPVQSVPGGSAIDFTTFDSRKTTTDAFLNEHGYMRSDYTIESDGVAGSISRRFEPSNVDIVDGALRLKVKGQTGRGTISCGEIESYNAFRYGTLETIAKATPVEGVCQGIFYYEGDNNEIDIELLSSYYTKGYKQYLSAGVQFTNQATVVGGQSSTLGQPYGFDPTADFHNYTITWTPTATLFYIDGELRNEFNTNVPGVDAKIIFNNWANGDPMWSAGPPKEDAYFLIRSFNFTPL
ncbi:glycoside hydrolase family 16 protein [Sporobolomyces koalae]|uniref:glycoside hydrolase family 16 protein n=1 Tax=Sporobolomyces koalae TaxID=500713 RepID=UPI0031815696